jgi:hypothetical protein
MKTSAPRFEILKGNFPREFILCSYDRWEEVIEGLEGGKGFLRRLKVPYAFVEPLCSCLGCNRRKE